VDEFVDSNWLAASNPAMAEKFEKGKVGVFTAEAATASFDNVVVTHGKLGSSAGRTIHSQVQVGVYDWNGTYAPASCQA
jgi:hypothetical protein